MMKKDNENTNVTNCTVTSESTQPINGIFGNEDFNEMVLAGKEEGNIAESRIPTSPQPTGSNRLSYRQRKLQLEEYRKTFLRDTRITDRKPVFVSGKLRDRLDRIVRLFGGRRTSVSGLLENIALKHVDEYDDDIEVWRKM